MPFILKWLWTNCSFHLIISYLFIYLIRNQQLSFKICHILNYLQVWIIKRSQGNFQIKSCFYERVQVNCEYRLSSFINNHHWELSSNVSFVKQINITKHENNYSVLLVWVLDSHLIFFAMKHFPNPASVIYMHVQICCEGWIKNELEWLATKVNSLI